MVKKSETTGGQTFSCRNCGRPYTVFPPDSTFENALISPCAESSSDPNHNFRSFYECDNCGNRNELYWCQGHVHIAVAGGRRDTDPFYKSRLRGRFGVDRTDF